MHADDFQLRLGELRQLLVAFRFVGGVDVEVLVLATKLLDVAANLGDVLEARLAVEVDTHDIIARLGEGACRPFAETARGPENERPFRSSYLRVCGVWHGGKIAAPR